jgi:hypothetical protein
LDWVDIRHMRAIREFLATIVGTVFTDSDKLLPTVSSYLLVIFFSNFLLLFAIVSFYFSVILYSLQSICVVLHFKIEQPLPSVWC